MLQSSEFSSDLGLDGCFWWGLFIDRFIDDVTHDGSSRMNLEVKVETILSANVQGNASKRIGRNFIANTTKGIKEEKWKVLYWPSQSPDLNMIENAFHLLKRRLEGREGVQARDMLRNIKCYLRSFTQTAYSLFRYFLSP